ncbi:MAG: hypothetical protein HY610_04515, partial [Elusimicrobia bacterium]|nr:hypothetical protein [Elusimicrobiota bacterium]
MERVIFRNWLRLTGASVAVSFLFTSLSAPFLQASLWEERKKSLEEYKRTQSTFQIASAVHTPSYPTAIGNGMLETKNLGLAPSEMMDRVLNRVQRRKSRSKRGGNIPHELLDKIERYGEVERVWGMKGTPYLIPSSHSQKGSVNRIKYGVPLIPVPLVIQIQDAHDIYGVQRNIALILKELMGMGVSLVGVEGSEGILEGIEKWREYPDREALLGVAGYLMKEGLLTGVELAGLARKNESVEFYGVEEKEPYLDQVKSFKNTLNQSKEVEAWKEGKGKEIEELKQKFYNPELKELDQQQKRYEKGELNLGEWIEILGDAKQPNISKYLQAYRLEKSLNFKQVESDQKKLLETLSQKLKREELVELLEESLAYRLGRIGYEEFYEGLKDRCKKSGIVPTPEVERYIGYVTLVEGIVREKLFKELKSLEDEAWRIKGTPYLIPSSQPQKNSVDGIKYGVPLIPLIQMDRDYKLLVKALDFRLSPEDWEEYGRREKAIGEIVRGSAAEPLLENVARFNRLSHQRNRIFVEKLRKRMEEKKTNVAVLVAGGYHSQGVEELLKQKNVSFITIRPRMDAGDFKEGYHPLNAFKASSLPLEKLFLPEKVSIVRAQTLGSGETFGLGDTFALANGIKETVTDGISDFRKGMRGSVKAGGQWFGEGEVYCKDLVRHGEEYGVAISAGDNKNLKREVRNFGIKLGSNEHYGRIRNIETNTEGESFVVGRRNTVRTTLKRFVAYLKHLMNSSELGMTPKFAYGVSVGLPLVAFVLDYAHETIHVMSHVGPREFFKNLKLFLNWRNFYTKKGLIWALFGFAVARTHIPIPLTAQQERDGVPVTLRFILLAPLFSLLASILLLIFLPPLFASYPIARDIVFYGSVVQLVSAIANFVPFRMAEQLGPISFQEGGGDPRFSEVLWEFVTDGYLLATWFAWRN